ncbi:MAG: FAD-binding oxidoreductase, partial [Winogradskyella sp.]|nr:FAD-binding oxidoreductase [Winogradskyella sp.]
PTVPDRRPMVGQHSQHKPLYILNGLGTRGVMIAPYVAEKLFNFIENGEPLDNEININRFTS